MVWQMMCDRLSDNKRCIFLNKDKIVVSSFINNEKKTISCIIVVSIEKANNPENPI